MKKNFFKKLFYPPNYLTMLVAGVSIDNHKIRYIEFSNKKGKLSLKNFGEIPLLENILKDGEILNRGEFIRALHELKSRISADFIRVGIPEEQTYIFDTELPKAAGADIREAIEFKLEENVPLKVDEVLFEYEILESGKPDEHIHSTISVIPKSIIESFVDAFNIASLAPVAFEVESRMIARSLIPRGDRNTLIVIDIKNDSTVMFAVIDGVVRFSSSVAIGESAIKTSLMKSDPSLYDSSGRISERAYDLSTPLNGDTFVSLLNVFSVIKDELVKFNEYIESKALEKRNFSPHKLNRIILCGSKSALPGFTNYLNQHFGVEIVLADVWVNVFKKDEYIPDLKFNDSLDFPAAIGMAIPLYKK